VKPLGKLVELGINGLPAKAAKENNELPAGHVLVKPQLAWQVSDMPPRCRAVAPAIMPGNRRAACRGPQEAKQQAQGRGLPRSVRPQQAKNLTGTDAQGQIVQGSETPVILGEMFRLQEHAGLSG